MIGDSTKKEKMYTCWLDYEVDKGKNDVHTWPYGKMIYVNEELLKDRVIQTGVKELQTFFRQYLELDVSIVSEMPSQEYLEIIKIGDKELQSEAYILQGDEQKLTLMASDSRGILYGIFKVIFNLKRHISIKNINITEVPTNEIRMINQWDNMDGSIERGYAGSSIFYKDNELVSDTKRIRDYARLLASVGINSISINNVNVHYYETKLITETYLKDVARFAEVFADYGIKVFLSINFASPIEVGGLITADPLDEDVKRWWEETTQTIYKSIPYLGGFLVKADSENRPGPFSYNRTHAEGANMLADALATYGGIVIWRCFVYDCHVDWRDRKTDRARAAYDHFIGLDGKFRDNVILQIKNGPMDFQIREPLSPLFGALKSTNQMMEFQITQEYTGQQKHICFLVPMWKEYLEFDTYAKGEGTYIKDIVSGNTFSNLHGGITAVSNIGDSMCWTGNPMAVANLYGFGRLCWDTQLEPDEIAEEWIDLTLGTDKVVRNNVKDILLQSRKAYENYTVPLGIGWMVNVGDHYGPSIEGYEYSTWGTYHYADYKGIGVDRTYKTGTGYANQYFEPNRSMYENIDTCPENLLLFFHHVNYDCILKDGRTLLQYIYDSHFEGVEKVSEFMSEWQVLEGKIEQGFYNKVEQGLKVQQRDAIEWRDIVNTYFYRKTGIPDNKKRKIYS